VYNSVRWSPGPFEEDHRLQIDVLGKMVLCRGKLIFGERERFMYIIGIYVKEHEGTLEQFRQ